MVDIFQKDIDRFYSHIISDYININICWEMDLKDGYDGYTRFSLKNRSYRAHRISFQIHKGSIPNGFLVRHLCHNKRCVNPNHLDIGTYQDNVNDTVNDNLQLKGSQISQSKLTEDNVREILTNIYNGVFDGWTVYDIGHKYSVSHNQIRTILDGVWWKHITDQLIVPLSNLRDRIIGRHLHKSSYQHPKKLTINKVKDIKLRLSTGETAISIAKLYGVSNSSIDAINQGRSWKHIK